MKSLIIILAVFCMPFLSSGQNFAKFENDAKVDGMVITQNMFKLLSKIDIKSEDSDVQGLLHLIKNIEDVRVLTTTDRKIGSEMEKEVSASTSGNQLEELMRVRNDGKNLKFFSSPGSSPEKVSQLFMFMSEDEGKGTRYVMLSIRGDIDLDEISNLAESLPGVPGAEELKNVNSK